MKNIILLFSLLLLFSCGKKKVFEKYEKLENYDWVMGKTIKFDVPIDDTSATYRVCMLTRHTDNYPYDGLLINLTYKAPNSEEHTKNYKLNFRDANGKFSGDASEDFWDEITEVMDKVKFNAKGIYKFEIANNMTTTPTQGIMEFGMRVEKK